jgi:hypothetical protein
MVTEFLVNYSDLIIQAEPFRAITLPVAMLIAAGIGAAGSLGGAAISANASRKANKNIDNVMSDQQTKNDEWWAAKQNENYLDTAEAQAAINKAREMAESQIAEARGRQAVMGGTEASIAAARESANSMLSDTISNVAATATARKDAFEQTYLNRNNDLAQQLINAYGQKAAQNAAAGSSALGALGSIGSSLVTALGSSGAATKTV